MGKICGRGHSWDSGPQLSKGTFHTTGHLLSNKSNEKGGGRRTFLMPFRATTMCTEALLPGKWLDMAC